MAFTGVPASEIDSARDNGRERKERGQLTSSPVHQRLWPGKEMEVLTKTSLGIQG